MHRRTNNFFVQTAERNSRANGLKRTIDGKCFKHSSEESIISSLDADQYLDQSNSL
mgnify:CR=1 FL=1